DPAIYPRGIEKCLNTLCICVKVVHGRHPRSFPPGVPNPRLPGPTGREPTSRPVGALVRFAQRTGVRSEFCPPAEPPRADRRGGRDGGGHRRRHRGWGRVTHVEDLEPQGLGDPAIRLAPLPCYAAAAEP